MFDESALELEKMPPDDRRRSEVYGFRVNLYMAAKRWEAAATVAKHMVKVDPHKPDWWLSWAHAARRCESIGDSDEILLRALAIHPTDAAIIYGLACNSSLSGRNTEAIKRLHEAFQLDDNYRIKALDDEDLKPLWESIASL